MERRLFEAEISRVECVWGVSSCRVSVRVGVKSKAMNLRVEWQRSAKYSVVGVAGEEKRGWRKAGSVRGCRCVQESSSLEIS